MKKAFRLLPLLLLFLSQTASSQYWNWVRSATAPNLSLQTNSIVGFPGMCQDSKGYLYFTGSYESNGGGTVHFDNYSFNSTFFLLLKYNGSGHVKWAKTVPQNSDSANNTTGRGYGQCMAIDDSDMLIVSGIYTSNSIIFGNDTLFDNMVATATRSMFLVKYDEQGNEIWATQARHSFMGTVEPADIVTDKAGNIYVTGQTVAQYTVFDNDTVWNYNYDHYGNVFSYFNDAFLAKYRPNGTLAWVRRQGGPGRELGNALVVKDGYVYMTGMVDGPYVNFGNDSLFHTAFLAKYDTAGHFIWAKGNDNITFQQLKQGNHNELYIAGVYGNGAVVGNATFQTIMPNNPYATNAYISCYDTSGNVKWAKEAGKGLGYSQTLVLDKVGRLWLGGTYIDSSFICGNVTLPYVTTNPQFPGDVFIASYDTLAGNPLSALSIGGSGFEGLFSILVDKDSLYVSGQFTSPVLAFGSYNIYIGYPTCQDWFFAKYILPPTGINDLPNENEVGVYPNPFTSTIYIQTTSPKQETFSLYDSYGKLILTKTIIDNKEQINTSQLAAGLYFYSIVNKNGERVKAGKVVKE